MRQYFKAWGHALLVLLIGGIAIAGLETVTNISDLNTAWPLGSDLASTGDDHMRNIKTALKNDFPNMNGTWNSASAPPFAIPNDTNTGMYGVGADDLGFSTGGTLRLDISTTTITPALPFSNVAVSSSSVPTNGIYLPSANALGFASNSAARGNISSAGAWTINAPTSGFHQITGLSGNGDTLILVPGGTADSALMLNGQAAGRAAMHFDVNSSEKALMGINNGASDIITGSASGDFNLRVATIGINFSTNNGTNIVFRADSSNNLSGRGATAANLVDMTPDSSTFTYTIATGCTTTPTGTGSWYRIGSVATLNLGAQTCTSNATGFTITGFPSAIQPAALDQIVPLGSSCVENNSAATNATADVKITHGSGTLTLSLGGSASGFTSSGVKGILTGCVFTYLLK